MIISSAASQNRIYSEAVNAKAGETVVIPVKIDGNTGFMGFKITIAYDSGVLTPVSVTKADALSGLLNDSIETSTDSSFSVVYSGTGNCTQNGKIFDVSFKVKENAKNSTELDVAFTQSDTFDEKYEDIVFNCEKITVSFGGNNPTNPEDPENPEENLKLSERIRRWAAGLAAPFNTIMSIIVAPVVFIVSLFEK